MEGAKARKGRVVLCVDGLGHLGEDTQKSVAMGMEGSVGARTRRFVGAGEDLSLQEVFARHIGERGHPSVGMGGVWTVVG